MKIENFTIRDLFKRAGRCSLCAKACPQGTDPHHAVITRGAGGSDIRCNLLKVCRECHSTYVDSLDGKYRCLGVIANRMGVSVDVIKAVNFFIANQLHRLDSAWLIEEKIKASGMSEKAMALTRRELQEAEILP